MTGLYIQNDSTTNNICFNSPEFLPEGKGSPHVQFSKHRDVQNKPLFKRNLQGKYITLSIEHICPQNSLVSKLQESTMLKRMEENTLWFS